VYDIHGVTKIEFRLSHANGALQSYVNHIITAASSVRGSSQLTLHLQSRAAAAAAVAQQAATPAVALCVRRTGPPVVELLDGIVRVTNLVRCAVCMLFAFWHTSHSSTARLASNSCGLRTDQ
jgi:hypothetical protein